MNVKTITTLVKSTGNTPATAIPSNFFRSGDQDRQFVVKEMQRIISNAYVNTHPWNGGGPRCGSCEAVLLRKVVMVKAKGNGKTIKFIQFKNAHEAMVLGKHKPGCRFARAVSVLLAYE